MPRPKKIKCRTCRSSDIILHAGADLALDGRRLMIGPHLKVDFDGNVEASCTKCDERFTIDSRFMRCLEPQIDTEALLAFMDEADVGLDWHEPDSAGVTAKIHGNHLDNAHGNSVDKDPKMRRTQEFVVELFDDHEKTSLRINLASLLAEVCRLTRREPSS